jgi:hypothetical protein
MNSEANDNEDQEPEREPKIIVDSDWKEQVAREKDQAAQVASGEGEKSEESTSTSSEESTPPPPPASFEILVSMLFTQAMSMLGQIPDPDTGQPSVNKPYAKHHIDTLEMLVEKTNGNLTESESSMLSEALHALRMTYVNVKAP